MEITTALSQFCEYSRFIRGYSKATIRRYNNAISLFNRVEGIVLVEDVTDASVRHYLMYGRTERQWTANSFITFHKSLLVFFRWCVEQKLLDHNPAEDIEMPKVE